MKWIGQSARQLGDGYEVLYSSSKSKRNGAGVVLDPQWKEAVVDVARRNDQLMVVKAAINIISSIVERKNVCGVTRGQKRKEQGM